MGEIIVGIDIGTSKVCTLIGKVNEANQVEILGYGIEPCNGMRKGIITDIENTSKSIRASAEKAENMAGVKIGSAFVNIIGMHVSVIENKSWINVSGDNREITHKDVEKLLYSVKDVPIPEDMQIIDIIPRQYIIDGYDEITDPVGMVGVKLGVDADVIAGKITSVQNIVKSVEKANVKVDGLVVEAIASGDVLLSSDDKELGSILIDVGAGVTDISVFKNKRLVFYDSIPVGGDHITNDISIGLKIPFSEADKIKKEYELALTSLIKNDQDISVTDINDSKKKNIKVSEVVEIIEARVYEILALSRELIEKSNLIGNIGSGVSLTGEGISRFDGGIELAYEVYDIPVRIASYKANGVYKPELKTVSGIIKYISGLSSGISNACYVKEQKESKTSAKSNYFSRILKFLNDLFFVF